MVGLLVGDALGVPYEFHQAKQIPPPEELELDPPKGFQRSHHWALATSRLRRVIAGDDALHALTEELETVICPGEPPRGLGTGYVVDCLHSARVAVAAGPYETAVRAAIALGNDTDTTAAVAGGIAGLRDGVEAIPQRWRDGLRGKELCGPLIEALCRELGATGATKPRPHR